MRQAGRYLPEFKKIRKLNPDFVKLCLDTNLSSEITLQPLKRFDLSAAIIFSDILMVPYGLKQQVNFKKDFGPLLGEIITFFTESPKWFPASDESVKKPVDSTTISTFS